MFEERPRGRIQTIAALLTLVVLIVLVLMSAFGVALFHHEIVFPPAAYALLFGVLYFIFGFRMPELTNLVQHWFQISQQHAEDDLTAGTTQEPPE